MKANGRNLQSQRPAHPPPTRRPRRRRLSREKPPRGRLQHAEGVGRARGAAVPAGERGAGRVVRQV